MQEKQPPIEKSRSELPIEQQANFEGSWTNLMCERLKNPEIRKQVIDLLVECAPVATGRVIAMIGSQKIYEHGDPKSKEQIEKEFDKKLENIQTDTPISFGTEKPNAGGYVGPKEETFVRMKKEKPYNKKREVLNLNWIDRVTGEKPTEKNWNIIESHEKGHVIREYGVRTENRSYFFGEKFWKAFDFSAVKYSDNTYDYFREQTKRDGFGEKTDDEIREKLLDDLKNPTELTERMSQLKNYFGINGSEQFTKGHLEYVREHYINDTNLDNTMTQFFQAITSEKEDAFIELINSAGI
jgi:hypothetical protein